MVLLSLFLHNLFPIRPRDLTVRSMRFPGREDSNRLKEPLKQLRKLVLPLASWQRKEWYLPHRSRKKALSWLKVRLIPLSISNFLCLIWSAKDSERLFKIDEHIFCIVSGIIADCNVLLKLARFEAQKYLFFYQEHIPIEQLIEKICNFK